jgi:hypothetical protein
MSLDSMLDVGIRTVVLLALVGFGGCVVPETVGDGLPTDGSGSGSSSDNGSSSDGGSGSGGEPTESTGAPEQPDTTTDGETGSERECFGLPDEETCLDAGCSYFELVLQISETCECTPGVPACLFFVGDEIGGPAAPDFFWHEATGTVAMFSTSWIEVPVGWRNCSDAGAPVACGCYEPFEEPACP